MPAARSHSAPVTLDWWKYTATAACAIVITCATFWFGGISEFVRRSEVADMVVTHSPYTADRKDISSKLDTIGADLKEVKQKFGTMSERLAELAAELRRPK